MVIDAFLVVAIGVLIGLTELLSRYRDDPFAVLRSWPAVLYLAINAAAALAALVIIRIFDWDFGAPVNNTTRLRVTQILVAGFGFGSSISDVPVHDEAGWQ